jgi:hypothetical protein
VNLSTKLLAIASVCASRLTRAAGCTGKHNPHDCVCRQLGCDAATGGAPAAVAGGDVAHDSCGDHSPCTGKEGDILQFEPDVTS